MCNKYATEFTDGRSPLGLRGLKQGFGWLYTEGQASQPTRAAWIETDWVDPKVMPPGRSPLGLRGLKLRYCCHLINAAASRSPLGLRGLKQYTAQAKLFNHPRSQPTRAAWIETPTVILLGGM